MTTSKVQTSTDKRCWLGVSRPCWRRLARPRPNGTQERWWLPSASSIGCAGWVLIPNVGTASTDIPTEFLNYSHAEFAFLRFARPEIQIRRVMHHPPFLWAVSRNGNYDWTMESSFLSRRIHSMTEVTASRALIHCSKAG